MSKYLLTNAKGDRGVIDGDTLHRFIESARRAHDGVRDDIEWELPPLAWYVAERLAELTGYDAAPMGDNMGDSDPA